MWSETSLVLILSQLCLVPCMQFKNNPKYRVYKIFKHTAKKSISGWWLVVDASVHKPSTLAFWKVFKPHFFVILVPFCYKLRD